MARIAELDALRGLAALAIVLLHARLAPESAWMYSAVDLFFVLSSFLISVVILRDDGPRFYRRFYARRALRIWPVYYLTLASCLLMSRSAAWDVPSEGWPLYLTFTQNVPAYWGDLGPSMSRMFLHTWTLAIEEQFYLAWPLLVRLGGRKGLPALGFGLIVLAPFLRFQGLPPHLLLSRCDGLGYGALLAWMFTSGQLARQPGGTGSARVPISWCFAPAILAGLVLPIGGGLPFGVLLPVPGSMPAGERLGAALFLSRAGLVHFGLIGLCVGLAGRPGLGLLRWRPLVHLGRVSYALYMVHPLILGAGPALYRRYLVRKLGLPGDRWLMAASLVAASYGVACLSARFLERPLLALGKGRRPLRTPAPVLANDLRIDPAAGGLRGPHREAGVAILTTKVEGDRRAS